MALDEQIAQITNSQEFTRLCNHVLTAEFPNDFQAIDGTRGDAGNDGYLRTQERIFAFHCPTKPEQKTDRGYEKKITEDLDKALAIKSSGQLPVRRWTFVTPRKLAHTVVVFLEAQALQRGLEGSHVESTYLSTLLLKHPHLVKEFPQLHISELEELMRCAVVLEERIETEADPGRPLGPPPTQPDGKISDEPNFRRVAEIRRVGVGSEGRTELRAIFYKSSDPIVQLNALLGVLEAFDPMSDSIPDLIAMCDTGTAVAKQVEHHGAEALLLAKKGSFLSFQHSMLDIEEWGSYQADLAIGMNLEPGRRPRNLAKLRQLKSRYTEAFTAALEISQAAKDAQAFAGVLTELGAAAGLRASYLRGIAMTDAAQAEFAICKDVLLRAKNVCAAIGDEQGAVRVTFALANQLRFQGEVAEAKDLVAYVLDRAAKFDDRDLLQKATWLKETLDSGKIPNYVAGERRVRTVGPGVSEKPAKRSE